jgi:hypothetical protein
MPDTDSLLRAKLRSITRVLMTSDWPGAMLARVSGPHSYLTTQRQAALDHRFHSRCARYFTQLIVESGPFAGLRYPAGESHGSALFPKLLGTYESELHPALACLRSKSYDDIVDVGFAEGYYLVGLAKWFPGARVWGFDLSSEAHRLCSDLAHANVVEHDRIILGNEATEGALAPALARRALVICDCEGCEAGLFSPGRIDRWKRADIIIECHDFIEPGITATISERLSATHHVEIVGTIDSRLKLSLLASRLATAFSPEELARLVSEGRPAAQSWIVATARGR